MTIKQKFDALVKQHNATIDRQEGEITITLLIDLPHGKVWACDSSLHTLVGFSYRGKGAMNYIYEDLIDHMSYGSADCTNKNCDVCSE